MINRKATIRWKGYDPDDLLPNSNKKVWANCDGCGKGRWLAKCQCDSLCLSCSAKLWQSPPEPKFVLEKDKFIPKTGIDRITTIKEKGYDPIDLKPNSDKMVWGICKDCGKGRWVYLRTYSDLCIKCKNNTEDHCKMVSDTHKGKIVSDETKLKMSNTWKRILALPNPEFVAEKDRFIPGTGIDRIITIEKMGYDPIDLSDKSNKQVYRICQNCGDARWVVYGQCGNLCRNCSPTTDEYKLNMSQLMIGEGNGNWQGGISYGGYCEKFNYEFKEMIRNLFNRLCFLCGMTEEENGRKLSVHHVNYDKSCLCNLGCEFVPLCDKCHGKTGSKYKRQYWEDLIMCYLYPNRITMIDL